MQVIGYSHPTKQSKDGCKADESATTTHRLLILAACAPVYMTLSGCTAYFVHRLRESIAHPSMHHQ